MSDGLSKTVSVVISRQTKAAQLPGFGIPLVLGENGVVNTVRTYTSLTAVADDYELDDPEYLACKRIFAQSPAPTQVKVGFRSTPVAQVDTITPTAVNSVAYTVTINGTIYSTTSDSSATAAEIVAALIALINADSACVMTASGTATLILTGDNAGQPSVVTVGAHLTRVKTTPCNGVADDILAADAVDDGWYCLLLSTNVDLEAEVAADLIETMPKIFVAATNTAGVKDTASTSDVGYLLKSKAYERTGLLWSGNLLAFPAAGWAGRVLPISPGSENWAFKTVKGVTADVLSDNDITALDAKNCSYYVVRGGQNTVINGHVASGDYLDITRGIDWLTALVQANVFGKLINLDKVPLDDDGIALVETQLRAALEKGVQTKFLASYTVTVPKAADISSQDKAARKLTGISFTAVVAGAVNSTVIEGAVTL